jgi:hypothetical protein
MIELHLKEENSFASMTEGGPSCIPGPLTQSPLESLLKSAPNYSIMGVDIARVSVDDEEPFESPVILLHDRKTFQDAVCIRRDDKFQHIHYKLYTYKRESDLREEPGAKQEM